MTTEQLNKLDGKVLCGNGGSRLPITKIDLVQESRAGGNMVWLLEIGGIADSYLVNAADPTDGAEKLPEPLPVKQTHDLEKEDAEMFLKAVNTHFGLEGDDALVDDGGDWLERFTEDGKNSIVPLLREKGAYFKAKLKNNAEVAQRFGNTPFFFSFHNVGERLSATKDNLNSVLAKLKAKREEAKKKAEEAEAVFG